MVRKMNNQKNRLINFHCPVDYADAFTTLVGDGKASQMLRNFVMSIVDETGGFDEHEISSIRNQIVRDQERISHITQNIIKNQSALNILVTKIENKREAQYRKKMEEMKIRPRCPCGQILTDADLKVKRKICSACFNSDEARQRIVEVENGTGTESE